MWNFIFGALIAWLLCSTFSEAQLFPLPPSHNPNDSEAVRAMKQSWYDQGVADYAIQQLKKPCE